MPQRVTQWDLNYVAQQLDRQRDELRRLRLDLGDEAEEATIEARGDVELVEGQLLDAADRLKGAAAILGELAKREEQPA